MEAATIFAENSGTLDVANLVIIADLVTAVVAVMEEEAEGEGEEVQEGVHQEEVLVAAVAVASQEEVKLPLEGSSQ